MQTERKQAGQNRTNLIVDTIIFLIFLVVEAPHEQRHKGNKEQQAEENAEPPRDRI